MQIGALVVWELEDKVMHKGHQKLSQWVERVKARNQVKSTHASTGSKGKGRKWSKDNGDNMLSFFWRPLLVFCSFILMLNWPRVKNKQFVLMFWAMVDTNMHFECAFCNQLLVVMEQ